MTAGQEKAKGDTSKLRIAVVASRYNQYIVEPMVDAAVATIKKAGVPDSAVSVLRVPGAWELPLAAQRVAGDVDAIVAIGALIRGETMHFDFVARECARGLSNVMLRADVPVAFGVLTVKNAEQGIARAGGKLGNRGNEAARAAIEMALLARST